MASATHYTAAAMENVGRMLGRLRYQGAGPADAPAGQPRVRAPRLDIVTPTDVTLVGAGLCAVWICLAVLQCVLGRPLVNTYLGGDFSQFYIAGRILNEYGAPALYDVELQSQLFRDLHAVPGSALWFVYSPVLAVALQPLGLLPFLAAYAVWCVLQVCFYTCGLAAAVPLLAGVPADHRRAMFAMALSFLPFCGWSLIGGQISALAFVLCSWAIRHDLSGNPRTAGFLLALCTYKPSLLTVIVPCLVVRANAHVLFGFAGGLLGSFAVTAAIAGLSPFRDWGRLLLRYARFSGGDRTPWPQNWPHLIDLNHFLQRLGIGATTAKIAFAVLGGAVLLLLLSRWRTADRSTHEERQLLWAATLTVTLLINAYTMAYDAILSVTAYLLTCSVAYRHEKNLRMVHFLGLGMWSTAILPASIITVTHVQWFTLALGSFGVWQSWMLRQRATRPRLT